MNAPTPLIDIRPDHWEIVRSILHKHVPQYEVWAFGSRATWKAKEYSDLDLAIITDRPLSLDVSASLSDDFSESDLPWRVDVVDWATTSEAFRKIIERDKVVVWDGGGLGMMNNIKHIPLRDLSLRITKGTTPTRGEGFVPFGINYIKSETITSDGTIDTAKFSYINETTHNTLARSQLRVGNVLFSMAGIYLGKSAVVQPEHVPANTNQAVGIITIDESKANPRFIHYSIQSPPCRTWVNNSASQSAQPNFNLKEIGDLPIPNFQLKEQRAIAHILGTLDDKIELNRRSNETLEAMARTLFKAWFVDFEPVRAKMEGRWQRGQSLPGLPAHLYDTFPDRLIESELGEIPEGWETRPVGDFAVLTGGKQLEREQIASVGGIPVFGGAGVMGYAQNHNADGFVIAVGRVGAYCGQFFSHRGKAWINNNASLIRQRSKNLGEWLFLSLRHADIDVIKKGAAQPFVSNGDIAKLPVIWPGEQMVQSFSALVVPILMSQEDKTAESKSLAQLRDTLLPKLISGELRVPDAERIFRDAV